MGKRKKSSRKPQGPKKGEPLRTTFSCLFCNHENSVSVKMDKKVGIGKLSCKVCGQKFQTGINYLSAGIDVYSDWVDACDTVAKEAAGRNESPNPYGDLRSGAAGGRNTDVQMDSHLAATADNENDDQGEYDDE